MFGLFKSSLATVGLAAVAAFAAVQAAPAQEVVLKLHQFLPAQAPVPAKILIPWTERIEKASGGRIKFEHYPAMQLGGKPNELIDQVTEGVADVVWTLPGYTPGRFPRTEVMELPFMMTDAEAASRAFWSLGERYMFDTELKDVKVLGLWTHGPGVIHSRNPIVSVKDLDGVKLRAPTRITSRLFTSLGATVVGMPVPAVPESLSKGVIDAAVVPWEVTTSIKSSELVGNHTEFPGAPLYTAAFILAMNKDAYDRLPDDLKKVIDDNSGAEFSAQAGRLSQEADAGGRAIAVKLGNKIIELTPDQIAEWKKAAEPIVAEWVKEVTGKGIDGQTLLDDARATIAAETK